MGSLKRKMARNKKKRAEKELQTKLGLFDKLGDECLVCKKPFDKTSKKQVQTWNVVVRNDKGLVRLYCPQCWQKAQEYISQLEENDKENA
jgi:F0F1-type ATP synthase gamma subunit